MNLLHIAAAAIVAVCVCLIALIAICARPCRQLEQELDEANAGRDRDGGAK